MIMIGPVKGRGNLEEDVHVGRPLLHALRDLPSQCSPSLPPRPSLVRSSMRFVICPANARSPSLPSPPPLPASLFPPYLVCSSTRFVICPANPLPTPGPSQQPSQQLPT